MMMQQQEDPSNDQGLKPAAKDPTTSLQNDTTDSLATTKKKKEEEEKDGGASTTLTLVAKWGKDKIELSDLPCTTTIGQVKSILEERTRVLPKRQKLLGLTPKEGGKSAAIADDMTISDLKFKKNKTSHQFILMGTPEEKLFVEDDDDDDDDFPDVIDDFDLDFNAGSDEWFRHVANQDKLKKFSESTSFNVMNDPRPGKPLLVLDLDHTLLDFSRKTIEQGGTAEAMKRPHMDKFLTAVYPYFDFVVWSQTSWRWLETKLVELGMLTHHGYKFCFVLDKTSMFAIQSINTERGDGSTSQHQVKPLRIIWNRFKRWGPHNTVHLDDLSRNFALNPDSGLRVTAFYRKKSKAKRDNELLGLGKYLVELAQKSADNFETINFSEWQDVLSGQKSLEDTRRKRRKK